MTINEFIHNWQDLPIENVLFVGGVVVILAAAIGYVFMCGYSMTRS